MKCTQVRFDTLQLHFHSAAVGSGDQACLCLTYTCNICDRKHTFSHKVRRMCVSKDQTCSEKRSAMRRPGGFCSLGRLLPWLLQVNLHIVIFKYVTTILLYVQISFSQLKGISRQVEVQLVETSTLELYCSLEYFGAALTLTTKNPSRYNSENLIIFTYLC